MENNLIDRAKKIASIITNAKLQSCGPENRPALEVFLTADLETSNNMTDKDLPTLSWSYEQGIAAFNSVTGDLLDYIETRDMHDFVNTLVDWSYALNVIKPSAKLVIFIHNLSYDVTYFSKLIKVAMNKQYGDDCLVEPVIMRNGSWLLYKVHNIEFRCSWLMTNKSLYAFTKSMHVKHRKLIGYNDYGTYYSDSVLPEKFHDYMYNDTVGLGEAICALIKTTGYNLASLPYTFTGFVRKPIAKEFAKKVDGQKVHTNELRLFEKSKPSTEEFKLHQHAYHGACVTAQPKFVGKLVNTNIVGADFVSHHPAIMAKCKFPTGRAMHINLSRFTEEKQLEILIQYLNNDDKFILADIALTNFEMNGDVPPFLIDYRRAENSAIGDVLVGSKVLKAYHINVAVTTPDLLMIFSLSHFDEMEINDLYVYDADKLPKPILDDVINRFCDKTIAKHTYKIADAAHKDEAAQALDLAKIRLNSLPGLLQESPIRDEIAIDLNEIISTPKVVSGARVSKVTLTPEEYDAYIAASIDKRYSNAWRTGKCFHFLHGVALMAYSRFYLYQAFAAVGFCNVLYGDTDSAYFIKTDEAMLGLQKFNDALIEEALAAGAYCTLNGKNVYMGEFLIDKPNIKMFKALSSKQYVMYDGNLTIRCTGIKHGVDAYETIDSDGQPVAAYKYTREMELCEISRDNPHEPTYEEAMHGIDRFVPGLTFVHCGGDTKLNVYSEPTDIIIDGHKQYTQGGACILKTTRTLHGALNDLQKHSSGLVIVNPLGTDETISTVLVGAAVNKNDTL